MKTILLICMMFLITNVFAAEHAMPPAPNVVQGEVLEVREVDNYTYLRLKTKEGETWAAVNKSSVAKGSQVSIENAMVMNDFESKSLKKTFKTIVFGSLAGAPGKAAVQTVKTVDTSNIKVSRAVGANAKTVAEIVTHAAALKDKQVLLHGKVVKYNPGIMGKNWLHLQDGSGVADSSDILVTTQDEAKLGEVVTVKGTVRIDKDFGAGYAYKVLIEEATLQK